MPRVHSNILAPSILAGDHGNLLASAKMVESLSLRWLHVDIMDGHFVPNLTFGPATVAALRQGTKLFLDVHLMLSNPDKHVDAFAKAGADLITIHTEPDYPVAETLQQIRRAERFAGLAINPDTPVEEVLPFLDQVDLILVMSVQPGFGGQSFRKDIVEKIRKIDQIRQERDLQFRLEVDGGINEETGAICLEAGADTLVAGSAFFAAPDKEKFLHAFPESNSNGKA